MDHTVRPCICLLPKLHAQGSSETGDPMNQTTQHKIRRYLNNLNEEGLRQVATQLLICDTAKEHIISCAEEFDQAFTLEED